MIEKVIKKRTKYLKIFQSSTHNACGPFYVCIYVSIYLLTYFLASSVATGYSIQDTKDDCKIDTT